KAPNAVFEDPIVRAEGFQSILAQFIALQILPDYEPVDFIPYSSSGKTIVLETVWRIRTPVLPLSFDLKLFTKITLDDDGKIILHQDHFSLYDIFRNIPGFDVLDKARKKLGAGLVSLIVPTPKPAKPEPQASGAKPKSN